MTKKDRRLKDIDLDEAEELQIACLIAGGTASFAFFAIHYQVNYHSFDSIFEISFFCFSTFNFIVYIILDLLIKRHRD